MTRKVILDMDPGVDDAAALCLALAGGVLLLVAQRISSRGWPSPSNDPA